MVMGDERGPTLKANTTICKSAQHPNVAFVACGNSHCRQRTCLEHVHFEQDVAQIKNKKNMAHWSLFAGPCRRTGSTNDLMLERFTPTLQTQVSDRIAS